MYGEISLLTCSSFLKNRMVKKGFNKWFDILTSDPETLSKDLKVTVNQVKDLQFECQSLISAPHPEFDPVICVPCKDPEVNSMLFGGFNTQCIYEFVGLPASGRSSFAMELAACWVNCVSDARVYYLDTEGSLDIQNFQKIFENDPKIEQISFFRVLTDKQLLNFFSQFDEIVQKNSLVVVDSFCFLLKETWQKDKNKPKQLVKTGMKLLEKTHLLNCGLVLINNFNSQLQTVFGESWASVISKRVFFSNINSVYKIEI